MSCTFESLARVTLLADLTYWAIDMSSGRQGGMGHISDSPRSASDRHFGRPLYSPTQIADHINSSTENIFQSPHYGKYYIFNFPILFGFQR